MTYTFTASTPGTRAYYSGTQGDLQVEMGLYGAIIVLPNAPADCRLCSQRTNDRVRRRITGRRTSGWPLARYDHPAACYDREYLFQFSEMDPNIHRQAEEQATKLVRQRVATRLHGCGRPSRTTRRTS